MIGFQLQFSSLWEAIYSPFVLADPTMQISPGKRSRGHAKYKEKFPEFGM